MVTETRYFTGLNTLTTSVAGPTTVNAFIHCDPTVYLEWLVYKVSSLNVETLLVGSGEIECTLASLPKVLKTTIALDPTALSSTDKIRVYLSDTNDPYPWDSEVLGATSFSLSGANNFSVGLEKDFSEELGDFIKIVVNDSTNSYIQNFTYETGVPYLKVVHVRK